MRKRESGTKGGSKGGEEEGFFEAGGREGLRGEGFTSPRINM